MLTLSVLHSMPIDVVEMIIVISKDYKLFETLKKLLVKFKEPSRVSRINDKFTVLSKTIYGGFKYTLNSEYHSEYDKPYYISHTGEMYRYKNNNHTKIKDLPTQCTNYGDRYWYKDDYIHRDNGEPSIILSCGAQLWKIHGYYKREKNMPDNINSYGHRYINNNRENISIYL